MKLIIDISEEAYKRCCVIADLDGSPILKAIKNGIPLPKGHGRLIDINDIEWAKHKEERNYMEYEVIDWEDILNAPAIIEAKWRESEPLDDVVRLMEGENK